MYQSVELLLLVSMLFLLAISKCLLNFKENFYTLLYSVCVSDPVCCFIFAVRVFLHYKHVCACIYMSVSLSRNGAPVGIHSKPLSTYMKTIYCAFVRRKGRKVSRCVCVCRSVCVCVCLCVNVCVHVPVYV